MSFANQPQLRLDSLIVDTKLSGSLQQLPSGDSYLVGGAGVTITTGSNGQILIAMAGGAGSGSVTSVGLNLPAEFTISGSPVTIAGTLTGSWAARAANLVLATSASGGLATPVFRALVAADLPSLSSVYVDLTSNQVVSGNKTFVAVITGSIDGSAARFTGSLAGDVTGSQSTTSVVKIQGNAVKSGAPTDGDVLTWVSTNSRWEPKVTGSGGGSGTVTSVGLVLPAEFTISGSPVTGSGALTGSWGAKPANLVLATSASGGSAGPVFRSLVAADIPSLSSLYIDLSSNQSITGSKSFFNVITGTITSASVAVSASFATTASFASTALTASFALTASIATNFSGPILGDVNGFQTGTTVVGIQSRAVSSAAPTDTQVLIWSSASNRWQPGNQTGGGGGGGSVTQVDTGLGLSGGPINTTGQVDLNLDPSGGLLKTLAGGAKLGVMTGGITNDMLSGSIANAKLLNSSFAVTVQTPLSSSTPVSLGGTLNISFSVVPIASGGTNSSTALAGSSIMISNATQVVQGATGTSTTVLHGNASGAPTYSAVSLTTDVTGILPAANGGLGSAISPLSGQVPIGSGSVFVPGFLTGTQGIIITRGSGTLLIGVTGSGDVSGALDSNTVIKLQGNAVKSGAPTDGDVLTWVSSNSRWEPKVTGSAGSTGSVTSIATGNGLTGGTIITTGQIDLNLDPSGGLSKTLAGGAKLGIMTGGVTSDMLSGSITNAKLSNSSFAVTVQTPLSSSTPVSLGGTLNISFSTVPVASGGTGATTVPSNGQILIGSSSVFVTASLGVSQGITSTTGAGSITLGTSGSGDVSGTLNALTVIKLQGNAVKSAAPTDGDVLAWVSVNSRWEPKSSGSGGGSTGSVTSVATGQGLTGGTIITTGQIDLDLDASGGLLKTLAGGSKLGIMTGGVTNTMLSGGIANAKLSNSSFAVTVQTPLSSSTPVSLGGTLSITFTTVPVASGGTGATTVPSNGQILVGSSSVFVTASLGVSQGLTSTVGAGSITLGTSGSGDVSGSLNALTVIKLQNRAVVSTAPTDGDVLAWVSANSRWEPKSSGSGGGSTLPDIQGWFGDGADGSRTINGGGTFVWDYDNGACYHTDLTIDGSTTLAMEGKIIFCSGTLTVKAGSIIDGGSKWYSNADPGSAGKGGRSNRTISGDTGGGGNGTAGPGVDAQDWSTHRTVHGGIGTAGNGGAGGSTAVGGAGGAGGTHYVRSAYAGNFSNRSLFEALIAGSHVQDGDNNMIPLYGTAGGGGGAGDGVNEGGGGGAGAHSTWIVAKSIVVEAGAKIWSPGGNGANGTGGDAGGGGGGGGGLVRIFYHTISNAGTISAPGGVGGTKAGALASSHNGSNGVDGRVDYYLLP